MASINLSGQLLDPNGDLAVGDKVRFTHKSTTGETIQSAVSVLTIPPDGMYDIDLEFGLVLVEYQDSRRSQYKNLGVATVNGTNPATSIPELLNALVPVSSAELIEFQAILADCVTAQTAAENAATTSEAFANQLTTADLISSTAIFTADTNITTKGFTTSGDGGSGSWVQNGVTGQTASQSPAQLGFALLNDGNGNQWVLVPDGAINIRQLGAKESPYNSTLEIQASINSAKIVSKIDISGKVVFVAGSVYSPPGIYLHDELTSNVGIRIFGDDMSTTQWVFNQPTSATGAITFADVSDELFAVLIDGLSMDGQGSTGYGISVTDGIRICGVDRLYIHSFNKNIIADSCFTFELTRSYVRSATTVNVELLTCTSGSCTGTRIDNSGTDNVYITGGNFNFHNSQIQSAGHHGIHGFDAESITVSGSCFFEANDKQITGLYHDIFMEDGPQQSTRYLNVSGGFFTPGSGVTVNQKAGPINVERANFVSINTDAQGNGFTTGVTLGANVKEAVLMGDFSSVGVPVDAHENVKVTDFLGRPSEGVMRVTSQGVDSSSYSQDDWQAQIGTDGGSKVGIGTHDSGRPAIQGFGSGSSNKLLLNPEAGNVGIGNGAVNPNQQLVVDGLIQTLGTWENNGHLIGNITLFANGNDLRLSIGEPSSAVDGILIGTAT